MDLVVEPSADQLRVTALERARAIEAARAAVDALSGRGVEMLVTGSLADGQYRSGSDIDFLVVDCPRSLKYAIEADVEDALAGLHFDLIYLDEVVLPALRDSLLRKAVNVRHLR